LERFRLAGVKNHARMREPGCKLRSIEDTVSDGRGGTW